MSKIVTINVQLDEVAIEKKIDDLIDNPEVRTESNKALAEIVDPWVPYDTGNLSQESVQVDENAVHYTAEYAAKQYYGDEFNHKREIHPLATAHWDKVAMQTEKDALIAKVKGIISRRAKNG